MDGLRSTLRILNLLRRTIYCFDILSREVDKGLTKVDRSSSPISTFSSCRQRHPPSSPRCWRHPPPPGYKRPRKRHSNAECFLSVFELFRAISCRGCSRVWRGCVVITFFSLPPPFLCAYAQVRGGSRKTVRGGEKLCTGHEIYAFTSPLRPNLSAGANGSGRVQHRF